MPAAPAAITPNYSPSTPTAPGAATASFSPGSPSAPLAITGSFSAGTPTAPGAATASFSAGTPSAPAAITSAAQGPLTGFMISGTISPAVNVFIGQASVTDYNSTGAAVGVNPPEGRWVQAVREGSIWTLFVLDGIESSHWWEEEAPGGAETPDLVASWIPRDDEEGTPVFTPATGHAWPPIVTSPGAAAFADPAEITPGFTPGSPSAPGAASPSWSPSELEVPAEITDSAAIGAPADNPPAEITASYTPATPSAPPAITT